MSTTAHLVWCGGIQITSSIYKYKDRWSQGLESLAGVHSCRSFQDIAMHSLTEK
jgi:hypothetical protein